MAKDKGKAAAAPAEAAPVAKRGKAKLLIVVVVAVVLLGGAGGAAWYFLHAKKGGATEETKKEAKPAEAPVFVKLKPFTVNLTSEGEDHYLQTEIELKVADAKMTDKIKEHMPEVRNNLLLLLSSKTAGTLGSMEGKQKLAKEIEDQVNKALGTKAEDGVSGVFFTSFVIQ